MTARPDPESVAALFERLIALPPQERSAYLERSTDDAVVVAEVASLLASYDDATSWFERVAEDVLAPALGALAEHPPRSRIPEQVDGYEIEAPLSAGGMGVVYRARDVRLGRAVALKFLAPELTESVDARLRLVREARAASALDHPNICTIYGIGETADGLAYIAMPCYDGETLRDTIARGQMPVEGAIDIALQVARGLARAHSAGITHRDLKPSNVMVTSGGLVKLLDFGLARGAAAEPLTDSGTVLGTLPYMSPEQIRGVAVDARTDVWSLGVLLYEMVAGRRPFEAASDAAAMYAVLEAEPAPLRDVRPDAPEALSAVVARMLRKRPDERLPDAGAVVPLLERLATGELSAVPRPPVGTRWPLTRHIGIAAAVVLLAVLGLTLLPRRSSAPQAIARPTAIAVLPFSVEGDPALDYLSDGMVHLLSTMLDGVPRLQVIDPHAVLGSTRGIERPDPNDGRTIATRFGAGRYVLGSVVRVGDRLLLSASLYDVAGGLRVSAESRVAGDTALAAGLDSIARKLVGGHLEGAAAKFGTLAAMTSSSLSALQDYLEGERLLRDGQPAAALEVLRRAVVEDSTFGLAWFRLARAAGWSGPADLNALAAERALQYAGVLPERLQMVFAAYHAFRTGDPLEAERLYRAVLADHPDDMETWELLGETLFHNNPYFGRPTAEARDPLEHALEMDFDNREVLVHLMDLAARERRLADLDSLTDRYLQPDTTRETPTAVHAYRALRAIAFASGDEAAIQSALDQLAVAGPRALDDALIRVAPQLRDPEIAHRIATLLTSPHVPAPDRARGWLHRALFAVAAQRWPAADSAWAAAAALAPAWSLIHRVLALTTVTDAPADERSLAGLRDDVTAWRPGSAALPDGQHAGELPAIRGYLLGLIDLRAGGDGSAAIASLDAMANPTGGTPPTAREHIVAHAFARTLEAVRALQAGRPADAIRALEAAELRLPFHQRAGSPLLSQPLNRHVRARALRALGRSNEAIAWDRSLDDGYYHWGIIY